MISDFEDWMKNRPEKPLSESSVKKYVGALNGVLTDWARKTDSFTGKLSDVQHPAEFNRIAQKLAQLPEFKARDLTGNKMYSNALARFSEFLTARLSQNPHLSRMQPKIKERLIDCVEAAGLDVSDWANYRGTPASNPKYCYEWCFQQGELVVINLWYDDIDLDEVSGEIFLDFNLREIADQRTISVQIKRALAADKIIASAFRLGYLIRVIMQSGNLDVRFDPEISSAAVKFRELDSCYWEIRSYDEKDGNFRLVRVTDPKLFASRENAETHSRFLASPTYDRRTLDLRVSSLASFSGQPPPAGKKKPAKKSKYSNSRERCPLVKRWLLDNTGSECECCEQQVFKKEDGTLYKEVHHVKQLSQNGSDRVSNAVAICANCHRELHYGENRRQLIESLYLKIPRLLRE